jgi:transcriptional regulator with XRE-family HTH domain
MPRRELTDPEYLDLAAWGARGLRLEDAAARLGVSRRTLGRILQDDERAAMSWARGRSELAEELTSLLLAQARKGNVVAILYATKCYLGFVEGQAVDGEQRGPLVQITLPAALSPEQWTKTIDVKPRAVAAEAQRAGDE